MNIYADRIDTQFSSETSFAVELTHLPGFVADEDAAAIRRPRPFLMEPDSEFRGIPESALHE